jgi:hypothetical protein
LTVTADDMRLKQHQATKHAIQIEMQQMREQLRLEQDAFIREKAEWAKYFEEHKSSLTV